MSKKKKASIFFVGVIASIIGYNVYQYFSIPWKRDFAMQQCDKYGGMHGALPIETEGLFDTSRIFPTRDDVLMRGSEFINQGLDYVEFTGDRRLDLTWFKPHNTHYFRTPYNRYNYYRVYVAEADHPLCEAYELFRKEYPWYKIDEKKQCIAVEGFDDPSQLKAPFELIVTNKIIDEGVKIAWNNIEIINRTSKEVVADFSTFSECLTGSREVGGGQGRDCNPRGIVACPASYAKNTQVANEFVYKAFFKKKGE